MLESSIHPWLKKELWEIIGEPHNYSVELNNLENKVVIDLNSGKRILFKENCVEVEDKFGRITLSLKDQVSEEAGNSIANFLRQLFLEAMCYGRKYYN